MNITRHDKGRTVRLALVGELDMATADLLHERVDETIAAGAKRRLVVDLTG